MSLLPTEMPASTTDTVIAVFTGILCVIGIVHAIVFALQARRLRQTVEISDKTAERQLRAYVHVEQVEFSELKVGEHVVATIKIRNSGQTPAYELVSLYTTVIRPFPEHGGFSDPEVGQRVRENPSRTILGGGCTAALPTKSRGPLTSIEAIGIANGTFAVYFVGKIEYRDIFERRRHTTFRLMIGGDRGVSPSRLPYSCEDGNEAT